jgi:hypothetical protein
MTLLPSESTACDFVDLTTVCRKSQAVATRDKTPTFLEELKNMPLQLKNDSGHAQTENEPR